MPLKNQFANGITTLGIFLGIVACYRVLHNPSWIWAEILFVGALMADACDGWVARKFGGNKFGPYLDDVADCINFGLHPALWIWHITGIFWFALIPLLAIIYRLMRFTYKNENKSISFSGMPSPAVAGGLFGIIFLSPEKNILIIGILFFSFLAISHLRFLHILKEKNMILSLLLLLVTIALPIILPWSQETVGIIHTALLGIYILFSCIFLFPTYVHR